MFRRGGVPLVRQLLRPSGKRRKVGWILSAVVGVSLVLTFLLFVLPFASMPDVRSMSWRELARGVVAGDEGAHEPDDPYFILGTNEPLPSAVAALRSRLTSQGWRIYKDPDSDGGVTFDRADDPGRLVIFNSLVRLTSGSFPWEDVEDYSVVSTERLREWQSKYANIYVLEIVYI